jgi:hypothetical protein
MKTLNNQTLLSMKIVLCAPSIQPLLSKQKCLTTMAKTICYPNGCRSYIDMDRAKNEIALVDTQNKTVIYGIDGLFKV